jgi:hypothetical protein
VYGNPPNLLTCGGGEGAGPVPDRDDRPPLVVEDNRTADSSNVACNRFDAPSGPDVYGIPVAARARRS